MMHEGCEIGMTIHADYERQIRETPGFFRVLPFVWKNEIGRINRCVVMISKQDQYKNMVMFTAPDEPDICYNVEPPDKI